MDDVKKEIMSVVEIIKKEGGQIDAMHTNKGRAITCYRHGDKVCDANMLFEMPTDLFSMMFPNGINA